MEKRLPAQMSESPNQCFLTITPNRGDEVTGKHRGLLLKLAAKIRKSFRGRKHHKDGLPCALSVRLDVQYPSRQVSFCVQSHKPSSGHVESLQILTAHVVLSSYLKAKKWELKNWKVGSEYVSPKGKTKKNGSVELRLTTPFCYVPRTRPEIVSSQKAVTYSSSPMGSSADRLRDVGCNDPLDSGIGLDGLGNSAPRMSVIGRPFHSDNSPDYDEIGLCFEASDMPESVQFVTEMDYAGPQEFQDDKYMQIILPEGSIGPCEDVDPYSTIAEIETFEEPGWKSEKHVHALQKPGAEPVCHSMNQPLKHIDIEEQSPPSTPIKPDSPSTQACIPADHQSNPSDHQANPDDHQDNHDVHQASPDNHQGKPDNYNGNPGDHPGDHEGQDNPDNHQGNPEEHQVNYHDQVEHIRVPEEDSKLGIMQRNRALDAGTGRKDYQGTGESQGISEQVEPEGDDADEDLDDPESNVSLEELQTNGENSHDYASSRELVGVISAQVQRIKEDRKFVRLTVSNKEEIFYSDLLPLSLSYEPATFIAPHLDEIIVGISDNSADQPALLSGQQMISPVLVCMPHQASFQRPLAVTCKLRRTPSPGASIKVLHSATDVTESTSWQETTDVEMLLHDDKVTLFLNHFCLYCVIEESCTVAPQHRHKAVSLYLRSQQLAEEECVEVSLRVGEPTDNPTAPALGGILVHQNSLTLINRRPVTVTLVSNNSLWQLLGENTHQGIHDPELASTHLCPVWRVFKLRTHRSLATNMDTLDFEVKLKQCQGLGCEIHIYESLAQLFVERQRSSQPNFGKQYREPSPPQHCLPTGPQQPVIARVQVSPNFATIPGGNLINPHNTAQVVPQGQNRVSSMPEENGQGISARPKVPKSEPSKYPSGQAVRNVQGQQSDQARPFSPNLPSSLSGPMAGTWEPQAEISAGEWHHMQQSSSHQVPPQQEMDLNLSESVMDQQVPVLNDEVSPVDDPLSSPPSFHDRPVTVPKKPFSILAHTQARSIPPVNVSSPTDAEPSPTQEVPSVAAPALTQKVPSVAAPALTQKVPSVAVPALTQEVPSAAAPALAKEVPLVAVPALTKEVPSVAVPALTQEVPSVAAPALAQEVPSVAAPDRIQEVPSIAAPSLAQNVTPVVVPALTQEVPSVAASASTTEGPSATQSKSMASAVGSVADPIKQEERDHEQQPKEDESDAVALPNLQATTERNPVNQQVVQYVQVNNNYFYRDISPHLPPGAARNWPVSYGQCQMVAMELDRHDGWKKLASKFGLDGLINWIEQQLQNGRYSPTELLLKQWMRGQERGACKPQLIEALRSMQRNDIADDLEGDE